MLLEKIALFKLIFFGVLIEAFPFIMLGAFVSSLIHVYVSEEKVRKYLPKQFFAGIVMASLMGLVFPVCECAIVPIARRLLKKGIPLYMVIPFMVSVPIVNPVVIFSTLVAFSDVVTIAWLRVIMGLLIAWLLGFLIYLANIKNSDVLNQDEALALGCGCGSGNVQIVKLELNPTKRRSVFLQILSHTSIELYDIGKYLIAGAFVSALFKAFMPKDAIMILSQTPLIAIGVMMLFAFVLSLCSEVDAFVARTFMDILPKSAILSFLVLGPMIDVKNFMMLSSAFKKKFVLRLTMMIVGLVFSLSMLLTLLEGW